MAENDNISYYKIMTKWGKSSEAKYFDSFAVKFSNGKLVDIVDLNMDRANTYIQTVDIERDYHDYPRLVDRDEAIYVSERDVSDYKNNSEILLKKLKNKDLEYIKRAAKFIAFPPFGYKDEHRYQIAGEASEITREVFEDAVGKKNKIFAGAVRLKEIRIKQKNRNDMRQIRDTLKDKEVELNSESEFAGFYEANPQKEREAKDIARFNSYKKFKGKE